ncbi:hypothetical protein SAMN06264364_12628 [Quadrisphaera granulorum]|uniref:Uncharacterized protein n=1 Tax=Quadrisphaera granulorum TaxID=317664 RepID=A0A315ZUV2_9ACTN|nr:hypothetical protein BXY45_12628 [Quadrisphaera granulorum]SZE98192.1 hypothetical protein SAMN06264364_12628 [Quadrisphaera granulorum]
MPGRGACPACGLRLVGEDAAALWEVDQELARLQQRRAGLLAALAGVTAADKASEVPAKGSAETRLAAPAVPEAPAAAAGAQPTSPWSAPDPYRPVPQSAPQSAPESTPLSTSAAEMAAPTGPSARRQRRFGIQQFLLVTAVVLVSVAALAFTASVWGVIGPLGQAVVLLAVCAGGAAASRATARRDLGASAEALAVLSVVVLLVLLGAARSLDVLGLGATDADIYGLGALLVAVGVCAAGDRWLRPAAQPSRPTALAWAAVLLTALVPTAVTFAVDGELLTWSAAALALAVLSAPAARRLDARARGLGAAGLVVGGAHLVVAVFMLLAVDAGADAVPGQGPDASQPFLAAAQFALLAVAAARVASRTVSRARPVAASETGSDTGSETERSRLRRTAVVVAYGGAIGAVVSLAAAGGAFALLLLALGVCILLSVLLVVRPGLLPWPVLVAAIGLAGGSLVSEPVVGSAQDTWWRPAAWYALALAAVLTGRRRPVGAATPETVADRSALQVPRAVWASLASLSVLGGSVLAPWPLSDPLPLVVALVAASALLALAVRERGAPEVVFVTGWGLTSFVAVLTAGAGPVGAVLPLGVAGVGALVRAVDRWRTGWVVPGVGLLVLAWWSEVGDLVPSQAGVEWWSLPPAVLALAVGVLVWHRHPGLSSWVTLGAGLLVALVPSALVAVVDGGAWRTAAVAVVGALACAAGVRAGLQAPVVVGAGAALLVAVGELGPIAVQAPVWVGLFVAGAVVLVLAIRIEQTRRDASRAVSWVRALR